MLSRQCSRTAGYASHRCMPFLRPCLTHQSLRTIKFRTQSQRRDVKPVDAFMLPAITSPEKLEEEGRYIAEIVRTWLDEEWTPLAVHAELGRATADAYVELRKGGEAEMGSVLLGLSSKLLEFNFRETFTNAFEVANKVSEVLMLRAGCDVCCVSESDKERLERVNVMMSAESD